MAEHKHDTHAPTVSSSEDHHSGEPHVVSLSIYGIVFGVLIIGTILTFVTAQVDLDGFFPGANTLLALIIAFTKMSFVVLFFMHVWWSSRLIWLTALAGFFWLAIMFAFTMQDYLTRSTGSF